MDSLLSEPWGKPNITCTMFKFSSCFQYSAITFIKPLHLGRGYVDMVVHLMRNKPMCENLMCLYLASKVIKWSIKAFPEKQRGGPHGLNNCYLIQSLQNYRNPGRCSSQYELCSAGSLEPWATVLVSLSPFIVNIFILLSWYQKFKDFTETRWNFSFSMHLWKTMRWSFC